VTADNKPMSEQVFAAVAKYLHANFLSELPGGEVLEIGCGNGLFSRSSSCCSQKENGRFPARMSVRRCLQGRWRHRQRSIAAMPKTCR
jgi:hypothetical protein